MNDDTERLAALLKSHPSLTQHLNSTDDAGYTPIMVALLKDSHQMVEMLLRLDVDLSAKNWRGSTVVYMAACYNKPDMLKVCTIFVHGTKKMIVCNV